MQFEHLVYSIAFAIIIGMIYFHITGRDYSWIIVVCAFIPDGDILAQKILNIYHIPLLIEKPGLPHGLFHTIVFMILFGIILAVLLHTLSIPFFDALFFSVTGIGVHLFEDALVYGNPGYAFLWPFSSETFGLGFFHIISPNGSYIRDFFGIGNTEVLAMGIILGIIAFFIRFFSDVQFCTNLKLSFFIISSFVKGLLTPLQ